MVEDGYDSTSWISGMRGGESHWMFVMQPILGLISAWVMLFVKMRSLRSMRYAQEMRQSFGAIIIWVSHQHIAPHSNYFPYVA